jgi:methyltransferase
MVLLHTGILVGALAEAWLTRRPPVPAIALPALVLLLAANALRWWVIATLGPHWNVRIMSSLDLGVVTGGPFRWIRHPNYVAVFVELAALPLVHAAYVTALAGAAAHVWVLWHRIRAEEAVLLANPTYRQRMASKPRFLPFGAARHD